MMKRMRGLIVAFLLLASGSAMAGCLEELQGKKSLNGDVSSLNVNAALQTVCLISNNDSSVIDQVVFDPNYDNAEMATSWNFSTWKYNHVLKIGKPALSNHDVMQFVVAHELAHMELNHSSKRHYRYFPVMLFGVVLVVALCSLILCKRYRLVLPVIAILLPIYGLACWFEYTNYLEDEHEADIQGLRLLAKHGISGESGANAFFTSYSESAPSFLDIYLSWPVVESLGKQNPHPSTYARKARIAADVGIWNRY